MKIIEYNNQVFFAADEFIEVDRGFIENLKEKCIRSKNKKARLCTHKNIDSLIHEMIIVHTKDTYVRPHKHLKKTESLHIIEGLSDLILFDDKGKIKEVIRMGDYASGNKFYYRIPVPVFHMLLIRSKFFVFHETTSGPFKRSATIASQWSPKEEDNKAVIEFMNRISREANTNMVNKKWENKQADIYLGKEKENKK